jgi:hypothetical protein
MSEWHKNDFESPEYQELESILGRYDAIAKRRTDYLFVYLTCEKVPKGIDLTSSWSPTNPYVDLDFQVPKTTIQIEGPFIPPVANSYEMGTNGIFKHPGYDTAARMGLAPPQHNYCIVELRKAIVRLQAAVPDSGVDLGFLTTLRDIRASAARQQERYSERATGIVSRMRGAIAAWAVVGLDGHAVPSTPMSIYPPTREVLDPFFDEYSLQVGYELHPPLSIGDDEDHWLRFCAEFSPLEWFASAIKGLWPYLANGWAHTNLEMMDQAGKVLGVPRIVTSVTRRAVTTDLRRLYDINDKLLAAQATKVACEISEVYLLETGYLPTDELDEIVREATRSEGNTGGDATTARPDEKRARRLRNRIEDTEERIRYYVENLRARGQLTWKETWRKLDDDCKAVGMSNPYKNSSSMRVSHQRWKKRQEE